jgi:hypothetical protein
MSLPFDHKYNLTQFTLFPRFPNEIQTMIWKFSSWPAEILSIEVIRHIVSEKESNKKKKVTGRYIKRQFSIKYEAFGVPLNLNGTYISRPDGEAFVTSGQLGACKDSRTIHLKAKPDFLRLLINETGRKIWINAEIDTIAVPRRTRFNLHQLRQRRRPEMVFFKGFENIRQVVFEEEQDENTALELLKEQIEDNFAASIEEVEEELFEGPNARFYKDLGWKDAVDLEEEDLGKELRRARAALTKVNGTVFKEGVSEDVKMLFFPVTEEDLEDEEGEEATSAQAANSE